CAAERSVYGETAGIPEGAERLCYLQRRADGEVYGWSAGDEARGEGGLLPLSASATSACSARPDDFSAAMRLRILMFIACAILAVPADADSQSRTADIVIRTEKGDIRVELIRRAAPVTTENFLRYVDSGHYSGGVFHRTVKP